MRLLRIILCWVCYGLGDLVSKSPFMAWDTSWIPNAYPVYSKLMIWSSDLQGGSACGPWEDPQFMNIQDLFEAMIDHIYEQNSMLLEHYALYSIDYYSAAEKAYLDLGMQLAEFRCHYDKIMNRKRGEE